MRSRIELLPSTLVSSILHGEGVSRSGMRWVFVFAGGASGALIRAIYEKQLPTGAGEFPWPTLLVNMVGAFILAWTATRLTKNPNPLEKAFLVSGFCGGLTTFATMQVELLTLFDDGHPWIGLAYAAASVVGGFIAARIAVNAANRTESPS